MKHQRIKAFTIMEITITMLIAAIVIGITFTAYSIVNQSYLSFVHKNGGLTAVVRLDGMLQRDFFRSTSINRDQQSIILINDSAEITYKFEPDFIIRTSGVADTFKVKSSMLSTAFEGHLFTDEETEPTEMIDDLSFRLLAERQNIPYHYHKQYSSVNLFKIDTNALYRP